MFLSNIPTLDLHGTPRDIAHVLINDFINDCYIEKQRYIRIIHGIGKGILKEEVKNTLKKNKLVQEFKVNNFNIGETLITLNIK